MNVANSVVIITTDGGAIRIGNNVTIEGMVRLAAKGGYLEIESDTFIGQGSQIVATDRIGIGKSCLIAAYCAIHDSTHMNDVLGLSKVSDRESGRICIGDRTWLGTHVVITQGVRVGEGCVIGANAVVTKPIPTGYLACGVPAKLIRRL